MIRTTLTLSAISVCFVCSCVSVNIGPKEGTKSKGIVYQIPPTPFETKKTDDADLAWQNKKNGNTISVSSICNEVSDPSLEALKITNLSSLTDTKIDKEIVGTFNERESLEVVANGSLDGVKIMLKFLVFKRNNCNYSINYIALEKFFSEDLKTFEQFLAKFRAP